jgi:hypothetical protein
MALVECLLSVLYSSMNAATARLACSRVAKWRREFREKLADAYQFLCAAIGMACHFRLHRGDQADRGGLR